MTARLRETTLADAQAMLSAIPSDDRDVWVQMGMALHHEFGGAAWDVWDQWSRTSDRYDPRAARATWRSFSDAPNGRSVTIGTLIHMARTHGWRPTDTPTTKPRAPERPQESPQESPTLAYALRLWMAADRSSEAVASHPYAIAKGITWAAGAGRVKASGRVIGRDADCLVVPIREGATGRVQGVQVINPEGAKQTFGQLSGGALLLGNDLDKSIPWAVVEGWADAVSFVWHWHHGNAVGICAFGVGRMEDIARAIDERFQPREVLIIYDADQGGRL